MLRLLLVLLTLAATAFRAAAERLTVAASPVPHAEILEFVKPQLAAAGVELEIKVFTDYVQPNVQVAEGRIDANFFEHQPFLDQFNQGKGTQLTSVAAVHLEPFGAYSRKVKALADLKEGATVAIPNDPANSGRSLRLLARAGLLTLKDPANIYATARDITGNPRKLRFRELEAAMLPRILPQVDLALINTNYALEAQLNPVRDALLIEDKDSPYANLLVTRLELREAPAIRKLAAALTTPEVKKFLAEKYNGAVVPAF